MCGDGLPMAQPGTRLRGELRCIAIAPCSAVDPSYRPMATRLEIHVAFAPASPHAPKAALAETPPAHRFAQQNNLNWL